MLDRGHLGGAGAVRALLGDDDVVRVVVAQVVRRHDAELAHQPDRACRPGRPARRAWSASSRGSTSTRPSEPATAPRIQVRWLSPTWSSAPAAAATPSVCGERALEADRDVAQPDRAVTGVQQRPGHDADRVGEVDDPRVGRGQPAYPVGDVEHDRHGAQRLGEAAGAGGLLPDAAALQRPCLVAVARRLAADAQLQEDDVRVAHAGVDVAGRRHRGRVTRPWRASGGPSRRRARAGRSTGRPGPARRWAAGRAAGRNRRPAQGCTSSRHRRPSASSHALLRRGASDR